MDETSLLRDSWAALDAGVPAVVSLRPQHSPPPWNPLHPPHPPPLPNPPSQSTPPPKFVIQMDEVSLLRDSLAALDDVFLVVVVGEFNSGKSTVINALLGEKFLADGILPTTNEISILKYLEPEAGGEHQGGELVRERDGLFVRKLPADLLKEMNIVDTPGGGGFGGFPFEGVWGVFGRLLGCVGAGLHVCTCPCVVVEAHCSCSPLGQGAERV